MIIEVFIPKLNPDGSRYINPLTNDFENEKTLVDDGIEVIESPNWLNMKEDLFKTPMFYKALTDANPNAYATLLKVIQDGENKVGKEQNFADIFAMLGVTWTVEELAAINLILQNNHFTITV